MAYVEEIIKSYKDFDIVVHGELSCHPTSKGFTRLLERLGFKEVIYERVKKVSFRVRPKTLGGEKAGISAMIVCLRRLKQE